MESAGIMPESAADVTTPGTTTTVEDNAKDSAGKMNWLALTIETRMGHSHEANNSNDLNG